MNRLNQTETIPGDKLVDKFGHLHIKVVASVAIAAALFGGLTACGDADTAPKSSNSSSEMPGSTHSAENDLTAEHQAKESLQQHASKAAEIVLNILNNPKSGTTDEYAYEIGNKAALVGPNGSEYQQFPESLARYYPENKQINIRATGADNINSENPKYWSVDTLFNVSDNSPITKLSQPTIEDFLAALRDTGTSLVAITADESFSFDEKTGIGTGTGGGMRLENGGLFPDFTSGSTFAINSVYNALNDKLINPSEALTNPDKIASSVNSLTTVVDKAANFLSPYAQR